MSGDGRSEVAALPGVSRETMAALDQYVGLVRKWNPHINLVSKHSLDDIWRRHVLDSAQLTDVVDISSGRWLDLGSGGGFPGVVLAILFAQTRPRISFYLVESDARKSAFLKAVARELKPSIHVVNARIEEIDSICADIVSARALAPLDKLLPFAERHLAPGGAALFMKGARGDEELARARGDWRFTVDKIQSKTEPSAMIFRIGDLKRA